MLSLRLARGVCDGLVHRDEPLRGIPKNHRFLGSPGMRVLVLEPTSRDQSIGFDQGPNDGLVGIAFLAFVGEDALAREARGLLGEAAVRIDGIRDRRVDPAARKRRRVRRPDVEVVPTMPGCRVNESGADVIGDMVPREQRHRKVVAAAQSFEGMSAGNGGNQVRRQGGELLERGHPCLPQDVNGKLLGQNELVAGPGPIFCGCIGDLVEAVPDLRRKADRAVARDGPGCRGPDQHRRVQNRVAQRLCGRLVALDQICERGPVAVDAEPGPHLV